MLLISHRGNLYGPEPSRENHPPYIKEALARRFNVEIDVWRVNDAWALGHDEPTYEIDDSFLKNESLWCHAKNLNALYEMMNMNVHCFWHQEDDFTLTSKGYIWTYPGNLLTSKSICVMPDDMQNVYQTSDKISGICSDFIGRYQ